MSQTYSDVDASSDPASAVEWQERINAWPAVKAYKERTYDLLSGADSIVDIGSGPGTDIVALGPRRCIGVEPSTTMSAAAAARGVVVCRADAQFLPFPAGTFAGARADRVYQHLANPLDALRETIRVVAPGGCVVIADPDQESLVIQVPGVRQSVLDRLKTLRRDVGCRHGTGGSHTRHRATDRIPPAVYLTAAAGELGTGADHGTWSGPNYVDRRLRPSGDPSGEANPPSFEIDLGDGGSCPCP